MSDVLTAARLGPLVHGNGARLIVRILSYLACGSGSMVRSRHQMGSGHRSGVPARYAIQ